MRASTLVATRRARFVAALVVALAAIAGCHDRSRTDDLPANAAIVLSPTLKPVGSCADLERTIEDALVLQMRSLVKQGAAGYIRLDGLPVPGAVAGAAAGAGAAGPAAYTTTNNQSAGVDEPDLVQNDGTRIAVLAGGTLHLLRSWPPADLALASSLALPAWGDGMLLSGDRAVVVGSSYAPRPLTGFAPCPIAAPSGGVAAAVACGYFYPNATRVTGVDVTDLAAPTVKEEAFLPGRYVAARRIGDRLRVVTADGLDFPPGVRFWVDLPPGATAAQVIAARAALADENERVIRARTLEDWLPPATIEMPGQPARTVAYRCEDFQVGTGPTRPGVLSVITLDANTLEVVGRTSVIAQAGVVYASAATLYVATNHWWWWPEPGQRDATYLHAFDLSSPDGAAYLGSGTIDGSVRDSYALDEFEGALRAVTTVSERVADGTPWGALRTAGRLSVLKAAGGKLELVGETPAFGAGERTFGTRFVGTRGFAITARQVDPLFTFDLSDPAAPHVVGELEMPGFLSYLHPIDGTHLLGLGSQRAPDNTANQVKLTLLDVGDLAAPADLATLLVGSGWAGSEALWDPHAFTWFPARKLLAIPFSDWPNGGPYVSDLRVFRVDPADPAGAITPLGALSVADVVKTSPFGWSWSPYVRRAVLADDYVYAVSDGGVRVAAVADLSKPIATAVFPVGGP